MKSVSSRVYQNTMATFADSSTNLRANTGRGKPINLIVILMMLAILGSTLVSWAALNSLGLSVACGVAIGLLSFPFLMYNHDRTPIAPVYLTTLFILVAYPIKLLAFRLHVPGVIEEYEGRLLNDEAVAWAMWMLSGGVLAYYAGYYWTPKILIRTLAKSRLPVSTHIDQHWYRRVLLVCVVGWGSFIFQIAASTWSSFAALGESWNPKYNQVLAYLLNYVWCGVIAAAVWLSYRNLKRSRTGIFVCITLIVATLGAVLFLMASKTWLMSPFLYLFVALYMNERRPPIWLVTSVTAIAMLFTFTFVPVYRSTYLDLNAGRAGTVAELYQTGNQTFSKLDESSVDASESVANIFNRFGGIDNAVRVMEVVPEPLGYFYFKDFISAPFSFVPRLIFPWKPDPETPAAYTLEVAEMTHGGSAAPYPVAEGYINFGFLGVIILFWLWGVYQSVLFNGFYVPRRHDALVQVLYAFMLVQIVGFGNWVTGVLLGTPGQLITLIPLILIFRGLSFRDRAYSPTRLKHKLVST